MTQCLHLAHSQAYFDQNKYHDKTNRSPYARSGTLLLILVDCTLGEFVPVRMASGCPTWRVQRDQRTKFDNI